MIHKLVIFGGTSEGRELAEWSADQGFAVVVSVATEYGRQVLTAKPNLRICEGRMDRESMKAFLLGEVPDLVVDATHPHALEVTRTIRQVASECGWKWIRVVREELPGTYETQGKANTPWKKSKEDEMSSASDLLHVSSVREAAGILAKQSGSILLTTGSKELREFVRDQELKKRIFARVLPDSRILASCEEMGIRGRHLIAMQGPFSVEMNVAMLRMTEAKWMVTKESGTSGGFHEKLEAARQCHVGTIVIDRPEHEEGFTVAEVKARLLAQKGKDGCEAGVISLIGMGMGGGEQLTLEALKVLTESEIIFGAPRMLEDIASYAVGRSMIPFYRGKDILNYLEEYPQFHAVTVVYSGDTGYHSGSADFLRESRTRKNKYFIRVFPGISTFSCLCARFRIRGETVYAASLHGQEEDVVSLLKNYGRVFLLLDKTHTIGSVCRLLSEAGYGETRIMAGIRLGYPDERLIEERAVRLTQRGTDLLAAMILEKEDWIDEG